MYAEVAAAKVVQSPDLLPLVTALAGAMVAGLLALVGAWIQSRREHARWLRERRYEAYVAAEVYAWRLLDAREDLEEFRNISTASGDQDPRNRELLAQLHAMRDEFGRVVAPIGLLGPPHLAGLARSLITAEDVDVLGERLAQFSKAARRAIKAS